jgi:ABC-type uncharacterized transport system substrate-binding protein
MWVALRRLGLGVVLITLVSLVLLVSEGPQRGVEPRRVWKVHILKMVSSLDSDDVERGMREGLASRLTEERDYTVTARNAHGDMPTLSAIVDAALSDHADLILTLSTPTLQAAVQRVKTIPIVFSFSSNPLGAGAGKSYEDHLPNVTGVPTVGAYEDVMRIIQELLPRARRLGSLVVPSEVNSVVSNQQAVEIAAKHGLEFATLPVNTSSDVADATLALLARGIDAICQVGSNLTVAGFASIVRPAQQARVPVFGFLSNDARNGAVAVAARDFYESGREAGVMAARVIQGESPAAIPFREVEGSRLIVNLAAAKTAGIVVPESLRARADKVLE